MRDGQTAEPSGGDAHPVDLAGQWLADWLAQRSSRRGVLAKAGRLAFYALGIQVVSEILPYGRDLAAAATVDCSTWYMCGFCGSQCGCGNCSGDNSACPGCACIGRSWTACCYMRPRRTHILVRYRDCFQGSCGEEKVTNCRNCHRCCGPSYPGTGPYWGLCSTDQKYMCTTVALIDQPC
jgi:hypothetical protein